MAWSPESDAARVTVEEFIRILEKKYPGISRNEHFQDALRGEITQSLQKCDPIRFRSNARLKGYFPALSDAQHIALFKSHTGVRTYKKRTNTNAPGSLRRNYGPGNNQAELDALFQFLGTVYISNDRPVIALRELIQNSADAINDPKTGSKAKGQIGPNEGRIDVTFDRKNRTLTVEDNGCGMTPEVICKFTTLAGSTKGKSPERMTPEELKGEYPPFALKVRVFPREGEMGEAPDGGRYWIRINGLFQFDMDKANTGFLLPADYIFDFKSAGSTGGYGAAKAVIFLSSLARPPRWELYTQDNYYDGQMADDDTRNQICATTGKAPVKKVRYRQGTKITIYDLKESLFDGVGAGYEKGSYVQGSSDPIEWRMKRVLAANSLEGITITFNGEVIEPFFPSRGGGVVRFDGDPSAPDQNWFDGIYMRPEQAPTPNVKIKVALEGLTSNSQSDDYQFLKGRDGFGRAGTNALGYFQTFQQRVEINPEDLKKRKPKRESITFDPGDEWKRKTPENKEVEAALSGVMFSPELQEYLNESANLATDFNKGISEYSAEKRRVDEEQARKQAAEIQRLKEAGDLSGVREKEQRLREEEQRKRQEEKSEDIGEGIQAIEEATQQIDELQKNKKTGYDQEDDWVDFGYSLQEKVIKLNRERKHQGLDGIEEISRRAGYLLKPNELAYHLKSLYQFADDITAIKELLRFQAALTEMAASGSGLVEASALIKLFNRVFSLCKVRPALLQRAKEEVGVTNPFGPLLALHVDVDNFTRLKDVEQRNWQGKIIRDAAGRPVTQPEPVFDEARYARFRKKAGKYLPLAVMWDQAVRQILAVTGTEPYRGSKVYTGFVLSDMAHAMFVPAPSGSNLVLVNPLLTEKLIGSFRNAADFAAFIHAKAVHEIAHMADGSSHGDGHGEPFTILRENIGFRSFPVVPLIAELAKDWTGLRNPYVKESIADLKKRYRKIAEDVTCPACLKQTVEALEQTGRLDTVRWIQDRMGWSDGEMPRLPVELSGESEE
jgi:hypothetical protein